MTFRVLIADDEELVRRGLTALIEREAPGVTVVGVAVDGLEALDLVAQTAPDVVLTDIRMPGLNGLDLIDHLRAADPDLRCIILSGYDEFTYARRAIGLGVDDYLLKPIDPDELLATLARTGERIAAAREERDRRSDAARVAAEGGVRRLLDGSGDDGEYAREVSALLPAAPAWGTLLIQRVYAASDGPSDGDGGELTLLCRTEAPGAIVVEDGYGYVCVLTPLDDAGVAGCGVVARRLYDALCATGWPAVVTAARPAPDLAGVVAAYREALVAADDYGAVASGGLLLCWEAPPARGDRWPALPLSHRDALLDAVGRGSASDAAREARAFMAYVLGQAPRGAVRALWSEMVMLVVRHVQQYGVRADTPVAGRRDPRTLFTGAGAGDPVLLEEQLVALATRAAHECNALREDHAPRGTIAELRVYIEEHVGDDLSIATLARRAHLNAKYLGELFKKVTGEPLGEYVIRTRMRHACGLLAHSSLKVYAVAERVGYGDPKHFATMFRHIVGMSPAEYRDSTRRENPLPTSPMAPLLSAGDDDSPLPRMGRGSGGEGVPCPV